MTLADKWNNFVRRIPPTTPREELLRLQMAFLFGSQGVYQILAAASDMSREDALKTWHDVQEEILSASRMRPKEEPLADLPPDESSVEKVN